MIRSKLVLFTCIFMIPCVATLSAIVTGTSSAQAGEDPTQPLKLPDCPVMGEPIDFTISSSTKQGPVFFCCTGCIKKYGKNAEKYAEKVAKMREVLADFPKIQVNCPVDGKPANKKFSTKHQGTDVHFCSSDCKDKFNSSSEQYAEALVNSYTYQTKCPVMGDEIAPGSFGIMPTGQKIYYCCDMCDKQLREDPAKYKKTLAAMGIYINPAKIKGSSGGK